MCREYEHFDILEVAGKCGIKLYSNRGSKVEFKARCPFCGDSSYHLGINRQKERFNCFRCGERGNSVSLYDNTIKAMRGYGFDTEFTMYLYKFAKQQRENEISNYDEHIKSVYERYTPADIINFAISKNVARRIM